MWITYRTTSCIWLSVSVKAFLFLTGNSYSCCSAIRGTAHFFPNTVSLVSPGAERLCKLKPFGLIDQILPTNALGETWIWSSCAILKTKHFEASRLWVLVSFESRGLLISIIPVCTFICGGAPDRGPDFPQTPSGYIGSLKPITSFGKYTLWGISLENVGSWIRPVGFSKFCLGFWKCNVIIHVWIIRRWSGLTVMLDLPLCIIITLNASCLCSPQRSPPSSGPQHPRLLQLQHCGRVAGCHQDGPVQRQFCQRWLYYIWCGVPDDHGVSADDSRRSAPDKHQENDLLTVVFP